MNHMIFPAHAAWFAAALAAMGLSAGAFGATRDVADGDTGVLYVGGELTRGACNIDTTSRWQTLQMGYISTGELGLPGQHTHGRAFHLHLRDCISSGVEEENQMSGEIIRVADQPEVRISFISEQDAEDPQLIAVEGAKGFGLRLEDAAHRPVAINRRGEPLVLQAGSDELTFWLTPERTRAVLHEGAWRSVVNMRFSYE
ncbi:type 1 fimbrial protein [Pantoea sp. SIMBA_072]